MAKMENRFEAKRQDPEGWFWYIYDRNTKKPWANPHGSNIKEQADAQLIAAGLNNGKIRI